MSLTLNQQVIVDLPPRFTTTIAASSSNVCRIMLAFNIELVLCTLKFLWSLAAVYFAYGTYIQLIFDSHNMRHFESYHNDSHGIRNTLVLVA